jgi:hypothetical protein
VTDAPRYASALDALQRELACLQSDWQSCFDKLEDLRKVVKDVLPVSGWQYEWEAIVMATTELKRLRTVEETWIDLVKRLREVIINTLIDTKAANLALTDHFSIEAFDEASLAVGLPISNEEGVPFELLPPERVGFKPVLHTTSDGYILVYWGPGENDFVRHASPSRAGEDFGERYAAWKAAMKGGDS